MRKRKSKVVKRGREIVNEYERKRERWWCGGGERAQLCSQDSSLSLSAPFLTQNEKSPLPPGALQSSLFLDLLDSLPMAGDQQMGCLKASYAPSSHLPETGNSLGSVLQINAPLPCPWIPSSLPSSHLLTPFSTQIVPVPEFSTFPATTSCCTQVHYTHVTVQLLPPFWPDQDWRRMCESE